MHACDNIIAFYRVFNLFLKEFMHGNIFVSLLF